MREEGGCEVGKRSIYPSSACEPRNGTVSFFTRKASLLSFTQRMIFLKGIQGRSKDERLSNQKNRRDQEAGRCGRLSLLHIYTMVATATLLGGQQLQHGPQRQPTTTVSSRQANDGEEITQGILVTYQSHRIRRLSGPHAGFGIGTTLVSPRACIEHI